MSDTKHAIIVLMPLTPDAAPEDWGAVVVGPFDDEIDAELFPMQHLDPSDRPYRKQIVKLLDPTEL